MAKNEFTCDCNQINHQLVEEIQSVMPSAPFFHSLAEFYKILADDTRCKIIFALSRHELCVCDLANVVSMSKSSISHQLRKMKDSGVVKCRRAGKEVYYSLDDEHVSSLFATTVHHIHHKNREVSYEN